MTRSFGKSWNFDELSCQVQLAGGIQTFYFILQEPKVGSMPLSVAKVSTEQVPYMKKGQMQFAAVKCVGNLCKSVNSCLRI